MALQELQYDPTSLDFGDVVVGRTNALTITVTNSTSPSIAIAVSCAFVDGTGLTLGSGDDSFSLAADTDTHVIDVTWTPTAVGALSDTLEITHDAPSPTSPISIALTGNAYSNVYPLADITNSPAGTMHVDLIMDLDFGSELTVPTACKITHIGELVELIDVEPGIVDVQNLEIELSEDYSTYSEGFWYHVIQSQPTFDVQFRFILTEGATDTFYFWGRVSRDEIEWPEHYLATDESSAIRTVSLRLVSLIHSLRDIALTDFVTEALTHRVAVTLHAPDSPQETYGVTILDVLASVVSAGFDQSFDTDAIQIRSSDFRFSFKDGSGPTLPASCYMLTESSYADITPTPWSERGYLEGLTDINNPHYWPTQFSNLFDLLSYIALNFGWIIRYYYGQTDGTYAGDASDLHTLEFITRGNAFATAITPEKSVKESTLFSDTLNKKASIQISDIHGVNDVYKNFGSGVRDQTTGLAFSISGAENEAASPIEYATFLTTEYQVNEPPKHAKFDLDVSLLFVIPYTADDGLGTIIVGLSDYRALWIETATAGEYTYCVSVEFYDYQAATWVSETSMQNAVMKYYNRRFTSGRKQFEREYGSLKFTESGTTSHYILKPMKPITIDDQISEETYYATEIRKDFMRNRARVTWVQA